ncbi:MAG: transcription termination factor Rho [Clostridia bacterium]|nr:transcription termination factor Rho [Clostridia bacterium]
MDELNSKSIFEIRAIGKEVGVPAPTKMNKAELIELIYKISNGKMDPPVAPRRGRPKKELVATEPASKVGNRSKNEDNRPQIKFHRVDNVKTDFEDKENFPALKKVSESPAGSDVEQVREGYLEMHPDGYGFLRVKNGEFNEMDAYVASAKIKQYDLRRGDYVKASCKILQEGRPSAVVSVLTINGVDVAKVGKRPNFDDLVPIYPDERIRLELASNPREYATRCIDLVSPIGKGQRGIIVSPPKAGKTTLLKMIANAISKNYPEIELKVLLIDERPEEVTDMQRSIKGEVIYSTFDELPEHHTKTAEMLLERAKRLVENGKDVVILLDSLTRLARAYNLTIPPTGRTLSGGIDPGALHSPKRFFGSARNIEGGGSLTIIATALIDTGSRMDDVIFEEFKGTGNMEIHLDRRLSEKRIFPAIDLAKSGTRKEELLLSASELEGMWGIRKLLSNTDNADATENILNMLVRTSSNKEFIEQLNLQLKVYQKEGFMFRGK